MPVFDKETGEAVTPLLDGSGRRRAERKRFKESIRADIERDERDAAEGKGELVYSPSGMSILITPEGETLGKEALRLERKRDAAQLEEGASRVECGAERCPRSWHDHQLTDASPERRQVFEHPSQQATASEHHKSDSDSDGSSGSVETVIHVGKSETSTKTLGGVGTTLPQDLVEPYPEPVLSQSLPSRGTSTSSPGSPAEEKGKRKEHVQLNRPSAPESFPTSRSRTSSRLRRLAAMSAPNGINGGGPAPYPMGGLTQPGSHMEVQHIWTLVEELSGVLQLNRDRYEELQEGIARAQVHNHENQ